MLKTVERLPYKHVIHSGFDTYPGANLKFEYYSYCPYGPLAAREKHHWQKIQLEIMPKMNMKTEAMQITCSTQGAETPK